VYSVARGVWVLLSVNLPSVPCHTRPRPPLPLLQAPLRSALLCRGGPRRNVIPRPAANQRTLPHKIAHAAAADDGDGDGEEEDEEEDEEEEQEEEEVKRGRGRR